MKALILALVLLATPAYAQTGVTYNDRDPADTQYVFERQAPCHLVAVPGGGYTLACDPPYVEPHQRLFHGWMILAGALQFADKMQTAYIIGAGRGQELNPILAPFANRPAVFGAVEGAFLTASIVTATKYHQSPNRTLRWISRVIIAESTVLGAAAVINNRKYVR